MSPINEKKLSILLICSMLLVSVFFSGCVDYSDNDNKGGITAMTGKVVADEIAKGWNDNSELWKVRAMYSDAHSEGLANIWEYSYLNLNIDNNRIDIIHIDIDYNLDYRTYNATPWKLSSTSISIFNWTIDSDEAYIIAINDKTISDFLNNNSQVNLNSYLLTTHQTSYSIWTIKFESVSLFGSRYAEIRINATSGEVIYAE